MPLSAFGLPPSLSITPRVLCCPIHSMHHAYWHSNNRSADVVLTMLCPSGILANDISCHLGQRRVCQPGGVPLARLCAEARETRLNDAV